MKYLFFTLRSKQWIKNFFIFLPMVFGGKLFEANIVLKEVIAFLLFSLTASVVYIVNDIIDIEKDKAHPTKKLRPIASGKVTTKQAGILAFILAAVSSSRELIWLFTTKPISSIFSRSALFSIFRFRASSYTLIFAIHPPKFGCRELLPKPVPHC